MITGLLTVISLVFYLSSSRNFVAKLEDVFAVSRAIIGSVYRTCF